MISRTSETRNPVSPTVTALSIVMIRSLLIAIYRFGLLSRAAADICFFLTTRVSESVTWMKTTMVLFEALGIWAISRLLPSFGLPRQRILIYTWHPLTVWEFAGSGHLDAMIIGFLALALLARHRNGEIATGLALVSATLVKFFPGVLLPTLYKR